MITLLDVNVLVALAWPNHVHHDTAITAITDDSAHVLLSRTPAA